jgi:RNA polymerase sigma-70 factor (ECF subfamily)
MLPEGWLPVTISEAELIRLAQDGDTRAFCSLAQKYERRIFSLALHYCRNLHDAEDLSQEVWLKAYQAIAGFRGEAAFYTWLRQIMINTFLNHNRSKVRWWGNEPTRITWLELDVADERAGSAPDRACCLEDDLHRKMLVEKVMQALGELTPQQRLIFLLKHREGMTYEEIARACGCSTGTAKKSLFRSITKLRQHLGVEADSTDYVSCASAEN